MKALMVPSEVSAPSTADGAASGTAYGRRFGAAAPGAATGPPFGTTVGPPFGTTGGPPFGTTGGPPFGATGGGAAVAAEVSSYLSDQGVPSGPGARAVVDRKAWEAKGQAKGQAKPATYNAPVAVSESRPVDRATHGVVRLLARLEMLPRAL